MPVSPRYSFPPRIAYTDAHSSFSSAVRHLVSSPRARPNVELGYPSAGKTTRALQLKEHFESKIASASADTRVSRLKVHLINDQTLGVARSVYHTAKAEKDARAEEYSAVKRVMSRDDVIIADGLNYIKGFRYQLYCEAKALQTPSCVVSLMSCLGGARG